MRLRQAVQGQKDEVKVMTISWSAKNEVKVMTISWSAKDEVYLFYSVFFGFIFSKVSFCG